MDQTGAELSPAHRKMLFQELRQGTLVEQNPQRGQNREQKPIGEHRKGIRQNQQQNS